MINTGSSAAIPPIDGVNLPGVYDSTSIQHASPFSKSLAIIGGGPIGLEFAAMFTSFGAKVSVIVRGEHILKDEDEDVRAVVVDVLSEAGIEILTEASGSRIQNHDGKLRVLLEDGRRVDADAVLLATGRKPATAHLALERAGIEVGDNGEVVVDDQLRTSVDGVFAIGDVHGGPQQTYLSLDDSRIVLGALGGNNEPTVSSRVAIPAATFILPPHFGS